MLILKGDTSDWANLTPEQAQGLMQRYYDWSQEIADKGISLSGAPLMETGRVLTARDGVVVDGPYTETKESIGGYYIIKADDYEQAVEIAKGCPALIYNGIVEVREVQEL
jgi:hypothetical protein